MSRSDTPHLGRFETPDRSGEERLTQRMARVDGCPSCASNTEAPYAVEGNDGDPEFIAHYKCGDCGHRWYTSWRENR